MQPPSSPPTLPQQQLQPDAAAVAASSDTLERGSLYVGDLHPETTEKDLYETFEGMGSISSIHLCRCASTRKSLCYAYVNFCKHSDAKKAMACLNYGDLKGKPMRIMWCQRDPFLRKCGIGNVFVKNLHPSINAKFLLGLFCSFGNVLSCKLAEENGVSKGYGFVQFESEESAMAACAALHDTFVRGNKLYVSKFLKKEERTAIYDNSKFTNLYVKNLAKDKTEGFLRDLFSKFGEVSDVVIIKDVKGKSRGFGFVNFKSPEDARTAVEVLNGAQLGSKNLFVGRAQTKAEREEILKGQYKDMYNFHTGNFNNSNLYVNNLDISVDDNKLKEFFSGFGRITSVRVMQDGNGLSKGFGFVSFSTPEEAKKALDACNGVMFQGRSLYVSIAQCKEDRCKESLKYHAQLLSQYFCPSNSSVTYPQNSPFYFTTHSYTPQFPLLHQQHYGPNVGLQYPCATENYQHNNFSTYIPMKQTHFGCTGIIRDGANCKHDITNSTSNVSNTYLKAGHRKESSKSGSLESSAHRAVTESIVSTMNPVNKMDNTRDVFYLQGLVDNDKPDSAAKIKKMILKMNTQVENKVTKTHNSEMMKLLKTPNSLNTQVENKVQVSNEANGRSGADKVVFGQSLPVA